MNGFPINACYPEGLKGAVDTKWNIQDPLPHLSGIILGPIKFSSFIEAIQEENDKFVWGAIVELKEEVKKSIGLIMMIGIKGNLITRQE